MTNEAVKYLTISEVAERAGVSRVAVLLGIQQNRIPATRAGKMWLIAERDADAYKPRKYARRAPAPGARKKPATPETPPRSAKVRTIA